MVFNVVNIVTIVFFVLITICTTPVLLQIPVLTAPPPNTAAIALMFLFFFDTFPNTLTKS